MLKFTLRQSIESELCDRKRVYLGQIVGDSADSLVLILLMIVKLKNCRSSAQAPVSVQCKPDERSLFGSLRSLATVTQRN